MMHPGLAESRVPDWMRSLVKSANALAMARPTLSIPFGDDDRGEPRVRHGLRHLRGEDATVTERLLNEARFLPPPAAFG
jgi:hypothetical protein